MRATPGLDVNPLRLRNVHARERGGVGQHHDHRVPFRRPLSHPVRKRLDHPRSGRANDEACIRQFQLSRRRLRRIHGRARLIDLLDTIAMQQRVQLFPGFTQTRVRSVVRRACLIQLAQRHELLSDQFGDALEFPLVPCIQCTRCSKTGAGTLNHLDALPALEFREFLPRLRNLGVRLGRPRVRDLSLLVNENLSALDMLTLAHVK